MVADSSQLEQFHDLTELKQATDASETRTFDPQADEKMRALIDETKRAGDTLGGVVEVIATGMPAGLGSYVGADTKLDAKLAGSIVGINAFKGVEFGDGFAFAKHPGSEGMDEIFWEQQRGFYRKTNHLGGFEGGMTNGMPVIIKAVMKPIPTLYKPLMSVDIKTKEGYKANVERSDTTAVTAAAVVAEAMVAITLATALLDKFDTDSIDRLKEQVQAYKTELKNY